MDKETIVWSPAGFWVRTGAWTIDLILFNLVMAPISEPYTAYIKEHQILVSAIYLVIWGLYGGLCNLFLQGTLGKKIFGLKLVDAVDGDAVPFWIVFFRDGLGRFISFIPLGLGFFAAAFNKETKTLHDHIFGTRVVRKVPVATFGEDPLPENLESP